MINVNLISEWLSIHRKQISTFLWSDKDGKNTVRIKQRKQKTKGSFVFCEADLKWNLN